MFNGCVIVCCIAGMLEWSRDVKICQIGINMSFLFRSDSTVFTVVALV